MPSPLEIKFNTRHAAKMKQRIALMALKPGSRKRVFKGAGRSFLKASKDHIRQQKTIHDQPMKQRKSGKGKLLKRMGRALKVKATTRQAVLTWPNKMIARTGARHQFGIDEVMTASRLAKIHGHTDYKVPATRKQAKALVESGFTVGSGNKYKSGPNKGKTRRKRPSRRWVVENMTLGQAGLIIRILRHTTKTATRWVIPVPARPFLGVTGSDAAKTLEAQIAKEQTRQARK